MEGLFLMCAEIPPLGQRIILSKINTVMAKGDMPSLRKTVTEKMYSIALDKNDLHKSFVQLTVEFLAKQIEKLKEMLREINIGDPPSNSTTRLRHRRHAMRCRNQGRPQCNKI